MKCVKGLGFLWVAVLAAFFALSACDDSSSASSNGPDENAAAESSSSSVTLSGASAESNGSSDENMEKDNSSSSFKGSEPVEVSSSSAKETKNSSDSKSSSSIKSGDSSSSKKDVFSSSSSKKDESSSCSSSVISSDESSSSYTPFVHKSQFLTDSLKTDAYKLFEDPRDHREYWYIKIHGKNRLGQKDSVTVFAQNLNYGKQIKTSMNQENDEIAEKYCYDNEEKWCDRYGGLYQWAEAMGLPSECNSKSCATLIKDPSNHKGICPPDWRLMTYNDYYIIIKSSDDLAAGMRSQGGFYGSNATGFSAAGGGLCEPYNNGECFDRTDSFYMYYPGEIELDGKLMPKGGHLWTNQDNIITEENAAYYKKTDGLSIRCVMVNQE